VFDKTKEGNMKKLNSHANLLRKTMQETTLTVDQTLSVDRILKKKNLQPPT
jgi:hypothetical protein